MIRVFFGSFFIISACCAGDIIGLALSPMEADAIIALQETNKIHRQEAHLAELNNAQVLMERRTVLVDGRKVAFRRIAPPAELPVPEPTIKTTATKSADFSQFPQPIEQQVNLQLYATVYDGAYSKLVLTHEKKGYTAWTNLNFNYLQQVGSFATEDRRYSYFGVTERIDREREALNARFAKERGFDYKSRWRAPPVYLGKDPEYVLVTEDAGEVPEEVYRQLDDLTGYYLANKDRLEIQFHNAMELQAARERYESAHPEEPQDIVLNYSRMSAPAE